MKHCGEVREFLRHHFRHFNAAALVDAAQAYSDHIENGGKMLLTMAGAMSTAELGRSLASMIREGKVHAISCTGANLEEDVFNLVAHDHYRRIPNWRELTPQDEMLLLEQHLNRVTDTCIPEEEAIRRLEKFLLEEWTRAERAGERLFPHQFLYRILRSGKLEPLYQIDPRDSWLMAACEKDLPIFVPGWEDSTTGNIYAGHCMRGDLKNIHTVKTGVETMMELAHWYRRVSPESGWGFFQIGGGIAGDFPICVVPMLRQDLELEDVPLWSYFCQISDSTTSYGSYSGATPNEKITWEKLSADTPRFVIESDATIVAPLVFAYVLAGQPEHRNGSANGNAHHRNGKTNGKTNGTVPTDRLLQTV
ncbi:MAG: deoxyhypusine synthase family protein [Armatimonadetes bacterium]|nr:deoxyhypusine synthase family protein [Armatimonadota bacterium]